MEKNNLKKISLYFIVNYRFLNKLIIIILIQGIH